MWWSCVKTAICFPQLDSDLFSVRVGLEFSVTSDHIQVQEHKVLAELIVLSSVYYKPGFSLK